MAYPVKGPTSTKQTETEEEKKRKQQAYQQAVAQHNNDYMNYVNLVTGKTNPVQAGYGPTNMRNPYAMAAVVQQAQRDTRDKWSTTWQNYEQTTGNKAPLAVQGGIDGSYQKRLDRMLNAAISGKTGKQWAAGEKFEWALDNTARTFRTNNTGRKTALTGREQLAADLAGYRTNADKARYEMGTKGRRPELGDSGNYRKDIVDVNAWDQEARSYGGAFDKEGAFKNDRFSLMTAKDYRDLAEWYRKQNAATGVGKLRERIGAYNANAQDAKYYNSEEGQAEFDGILDEIAQQFVGKKYADIMYTEDGQTVRNIYGEASRAIDNNDWDGFVRQHTMTGYANAGENGQYFSNDWWATRADNMAASLEATETLDRELRTLGGFGSRDAGKYNPTESGTELIDLINSKDARDRATAEKIQRTGEANWNLATDKELDILDSVEMMTPVEIDKANRWYNLAQQGLAEPDALDRYMNALQGQLWMRQAQAESAQQQDEIQNGNFFDNLLQFGARAGINATVNPLQGWMNIAGALFGNEMANDPNSPAFRGQQFVANMDAGLSAKLDALTGNKGIGQFFYGVAASSVDSMLSSLLGSAAGPSLVENVSLAIMGSEAMSRSLYDGLKAGKSAGESVMDALASGAIETLTEKIAWKDIFQGKSGFKAWLQATLEEGAEEGVGSIGEKAYQDFKRIVFGHETDIEQQVNEMMARNPGMPINKVMASVLGQYAAELGKDILAGAASGAGMSGVMQIINGVSSSVTGARIVSNGIVTDPNAGKVTGSGSGVTLPENQMLPNVLAQNAGMEVAGTAAAPTRPYTSPTGAITEASVQDQSSARTGIDPKYQSYLENLTPEEQARLESRMAGETAPAANVAPEATTPELTPEQSARQEQRSQGKQAPAPAPEQKTTQATPPERPRRQKATLADNKNVNRLLGLGDAFGADTEAGKAAAEIRSNLKKGKRVSFAQVGRLWQSVAKDLPESGRKTLRGILTQSVQDQLETRNVAKNKISMLADIIGKVAEGEELTTGEFRELAGDRNAMDVMREFVYDEFATDATRKAYAERAVASVKNAITEAEVYGMAAKRKKGGASSVRAPRRRDEAAHRAEAAEKAAALTNKNKAARKAESRRATFTETAKDGTETELNGDVTRITDIEVDKKTGYGTVTVQVKTRDGQIHEVTADPGEIQLDGSGTAAIIAEISTDGSRYTAEEANGILQTYKGGDVQNHINEFEAAYRLGWQNYNLPEKATDTQKIAYDLGKQYARDRIELRNKIQAQAKAATKGKGSVRLETEGETAVTTFKTLQDIMHSGDEQQTSAIDVLGRIADALKVNIVLFESKADKTGHYTGADGYYDRSTNTIGIDLNAGRNSQDDMSRHALLTIAGHELTHYIENRVGGEAYEALVRLARAEMDKVGQDWDEAVERRMSWNGENLSKDEARSELVADIMSDMLRDETKLRTLLQNAAQSNSTLFQRITNFLKNLANRLRSAFGSENTLKTEANAILQAGGYTSETVDMWYRLLEEASQIEAESAQTENAAASSRQASARNTAYMEAVENGDTETQQRLVDEAAREAGVFVNGRGRPIRLYHGTQHFGFTVFDMERTKFGIGAVYATSNESVANGYSEFGQNRGASSKYIEDDGTDKTIIRNAKNVLNNEYERLSPERAEEIHQKLLEKFRKQADAENDAMNASPDYAPPAEADTDFWETVQAFNDLLNEDEYLFDPDEEYRNNYRTTGNNWVADRNKVEAMDRLREYFNTHDDEMQRLKTEGRGYYDLLYKGYDQVDGIIDLEYEYKKLLDPGALFAAKGSDLVTTRDELQRRILNEKNKGNYTLYGISGENPLVIDAEKSFWTGIKAPMIGEGYYSTDSIVKWAKDNGYTSVVIKNVMDPGVVNAYGDDYIFFNSEQLKSADPVTYDDAGNVIPLDERFKKENPDIRYSARNTAYMEAVEANDMETAQRLVDEAAKEAGYNPIKLHHGTRGFGFTKFDLSLGEGLIFATDDRQTAETYSGKTKRSRISERTKMDADNLHGQELMDEAQKYLDQYEGYYLVPQTEKVKRTDEARARIRRFVQRSNEFVKDHNGAFNAEKEAAVQRLIDAINDMSNAKTDDDLLEAWNVWDSATWDFKWLDPDLFDEFLQTIKSLELYDAKNQLHDFMYEGDMYMKDDKWFSSIIFDKQLRLELNAELHKGVYELYGRSDKQLVIDAKGRNWNSIIAPDELQLYGPQKTRDVAAAAKAHGYHSVKIENLRDSGGETDYNRPSTIYIYFDANAVKSADPVTYDDAGNVIPLDERFKKSNKDIRYSARSSFRSDLNKTEAEAFDNLDETSQDIVAALGKGTKIQSRDGEMELAVSRDKHTVAYSARTYHEGGRDKLRQALIDNGHTKTEADATCKEIDDMLDWLMNTAAEMAKDQAYTNMYDTRKKGYTNLYEHLMARVDTYIKEGTVPRQVLSTLVKNGDYPVNMDLTLGCKKRIAYTMLIKRMIEDGVFDNVTLSGESIAELNNILREHGFETACLGCFVESRRLQIQKWAESFVDDWNAEVDKRTKNAGTFGFAEGKTKEITDREREALAIELEKAGKKNDAGNLSLETGSVPQKIGELLDRVKSLRQHLTVADMLTTDGMTMLRTYDQNLYSLILQHYGANTPKILQDFNPYSSEVANLSFDFAKAITNKEITGAGKYITNAENKLSRRKRESEKAYRGRVETEAMRQYLYDIGGARTQSFSDFMIENVFDYLQIVADMAAREFPMHGYSKEIVCLRLFGMTGTKWNGSLIAHVDNDIVKQYGRQYAGLMPVSEAEAGRAIKVTVDGQDFAIGFDDYARHVFTKGKSFIQSIGMKDILALQLDPRYAKNVGSITIGVSDKQILAMLDSPLFPMVIPYHKSGIMPGFAKLIGVDKYSDYQRYQETKLKAIYDKNHNVVDSLTGKNGKPISIKTKFDFNAEVQRTGDARTAADNYLAWCKEHPVYDGKDIVGYVSCIPKFSTTKDGTDFTKHRNYYKLLEDFNTYDVGTGESAVQGPVKMVFPSEQNRLTAAQLETYKQALRDTGVFSDAEIDKYAKKAQMTFKEIVEAELKNRAEYESSQAKEWEPAIRDAEDLLLGKYASTRESRREDGDTKPKKGKGKVQASQRDYNRIDTAKYLLDLAARDPEGRTLGTQVERDALKKFSTDWQEYQKAKSYADAYREAANYIKENYDIDQNKKARDGYEEDIEKALEYTKQANNLLAGLYRLSDEGALGDMMRQAEHITDILSGSTRQRLGKAAKGIAQEARDVRRVLNKTANDMQAEIDRLTRTLADDDPNKPSKISGKWAALYDTQTTKKLVAQLRKDGLRYGNSNATELANALAILASMQDEMDRQELAERLAEHFMKTQRSDQNLLQSEFISQITGGSIVLGYDDVKYIRETYGYTVKEFQKKLGYATKVSVDKTRSTHADHIADDAPEWAYNVLFPENMSGSEATALDSLMNIVEGGRGTQMEESYNGQTYDEMVGAYSDALLKAADGMKLADEADAARLRDAEAAIRETQNAVREAAKYYQDLFTKDKIESLKRLRDQLKSEAVQQMAEYKQQVIEREHQQKQIRDIAKETATARRSIIRDVKKIDHLIRHETDYKNVPETYKPLAETMVSLIVSNDQNGNALVFDKKSAAKLANTYARIAMMDDQTGPLYDEEVMSALDELSTQIDERGMLRSLPGQTLLEKAQNERETVSRISEAVHYLTSVIQSSRDAFFNGRKVQIEEAAQPLVEGLNARKSYGELQGTGARALVMADRFIRTNNMTPVYYVRAVGNEGLTALMDGMFDGESTYGIQLGDADNRITEIQKDHNYQTWAGIPGDKFTFVTEGGRKITLTREQALSIYAAYKREHLNGMESHHLDQGGIVFLAENEGGRLHRESEETVNRRTSPAQITTADMDQINAWLTDEQKSYADEMVAYLSDDMSEIGNETSMAMFGIRKYKEKYYFPFRSYSGALHQRSDAGSTSTTSDARIKHAGFTNALIRKAATPLVVDDFTTVVKGHVAEMLTYGNFAVPIESMNRVLNHKLDDGTTVRTLFERKYGANMTAYLKDYLRDLNGGVQSDSRASAISKFISLFKKGAVVASVSVALQQPLSLIRAYTVMDKAALIQAHKRTPRSAWNRSFEEAKQYAGTAVIKDMGRFDTGVGRSAVEYLGMDVNQTAKDKAKAKADQLVGWGPETMDKMAWGIMWEATKIEQAKLDPGANPNSEEFLQRCGKRFDEIMRLTQVYDSTLSRSANMRAKDPFMQMVTSFMAEPTLTMNMLYDAFANGRKGNRIRISKTGAAGAFVISALMQSVIKAAMSAARRKKQDEDKSFIEKMTATVIENFGDEINPLNSIPGLRDVWSLMHGDSVDRADLTVVNELVKAADKLSKTFENGLGGTGAYENLYIATEEFGGSLAKLFGIPAKNILRDVRAAWNFVEDVTDDKRPNWQNIGMTAADAALGRTGAKAKSKHYESLYNALRKNDKAAAEREASYLTASLGASEQTVGTKLKSLIRDGFVAGDLNDNEAVKLLVSNGYSKTEKEAYTYLGKAADKAEHKGEEGYTGSGSVYGPVLDAVHNSDWSAASTEIRLLASHDIDEEAVVTKIRSDTKDRYLKGEIGDDQAAALLERYSSNPKETEHDRYWKLREWDYQKTHGKDAKWSKYQDLDDALDSGNESAIYDAMRELAEHGVKQSTLKSSLTKWRKMREDAGITINGAVLMAYNKARKSYVNKVY